MRQKFMLRYSLSYSPLFQKMADFKELIIWDLQKFIVLLCCSLSPPFVVHFFEHCSQKRLSNNIQLKKRHFNIQH